MYTAKLERLARPVIHRLNAVGIMSRPLWVPLNRLPAFERCPCATTLSEVESLYRHGISLPCSVGLDATAQDKVMRELSRDLSART